MTLPDGSPYSGLTLADTDRLAKAFQIGAREVEISALEADIIPERYARNLKSFSAADQAALLKSSALIVGLGGLGGAVTEILARIGIGRLTLVDGDRFEAHNLNRQFLSTEAGLQAPKAKAALKRVLQINSSVTVHPVPEFLTAKNAANLVAGAGIAIDCLDNLKTRFVLQKAAQKEGIPMVSAAVAGATGHVTAIFPEDKGLQLIYGTARNAPDKGAETTLGCLPQAVTLIAALECSEAVKILLNKGSLLRNQMLMVDLQDNIFEKFKLA